MNATPQTSDADRPTDELPKTSEALLRTMSRIGWAMFIAWATTLVIWAILYPDPYASGWRLVLELAFLGRLVNISDGITDGFSRLYLFVQSGPQDIILLLIVYPWAVSAYEGSPKKRPFRRSIESLRRTAERNKRFVEPFGAIGLWVFVFFPFWSTGALIGGIVGYLLGMRTWIVFASVLTGHFLSVIALIGFFEITYEAALAFSDGLARFLPWIVIAILLLLMFAGRLHRRLRARKASPEHEAGDDAP